MEYLSPFGLGGAGGSMVEDALETASSNLKVDVKDNLESQPVVQKDGDVGSGGGGWGGEEVGKPEMEQRFTVNGVV